MKYSIPAANRRIYQTPRERFGAPTTAVTSRRHLLGKDYYSEQQQRAYRKAKIAIVVILVLLLVQSIFQVPFLQIRNVEIRGLKYVSVQDVRPFIIAELQRRRFIFFKNSNYFLFAKNRLRKRLESRFYVNVTELTKKFPNTLHVTVKERISGFVIQKPDGYLMVDTHGAVVSSVTEPPPNQTIVVDERTDTTASIGLPYLEAITQIQQLWHENIASPVIDTFHLVDDAAKIVVRTDKGFQVFFSSGNALAPQISRLAQYLHDPGYEQPHDHIDVRFEDKLYIQ